MKSKSIYWKYVLLKIKYIFLRDCYVCTRWILIFKSDQAQINSAAQSEGRIFFLLKTWIWYSAESSLSFRLGFGIGLNILCVLYLDLVLG